MAVRIGGTQMYLRRAVDSEGEVLDVLVQRRRDKAAARKLMRKLLRKQGFAARRGHDRQAALLRAAFSELGLAARHEQGLRKNNRAEVSHQPVRRRERKMQRFKSPGSAQRFVSMHLEFPDLLRLAVGLAEEHAAARVLVEDASSGTALAQALPAQTRAVVVPIRPKLDKPAQLPANTTVLKAASRCCSKRTPWAADGWPFWCSTPRPRWSRPRPETSGRAARDGRPRRNGTADRGAVAPDQDHPRRCGGRGAALRGAAGRAGSAPDELVAERLPDMRRRGP